MKLFRWSDDNRFWIIWIAILFLLFDTIAPDHPILYSIYKVFNIKGEYKDIQVWDSGGEDEYGHQRPEGWETQKGFFPSRNNDKLKRDIIDTTIRIFYLVWIIIPIYFARQYYVIHKQ